MAGSRRRGATPAIEPRIRDEIGAIAVVAFALLSTVALATDQGAVLQWWRSALFALLGWAAWLVPLALGAIALELWFGFVRRETVLPIVGGLVIVVGEAVEARGRSAGNEGAGLEPAYGRALPPHGFP